MYRDRVNKFILFLKTTTVNILLHATVSAIDYTPNVVSKRCLFFILKHSWALKRSWKISRGVPGKFWERTGFFSGERVGTLFIVSIIAGDKSTVPFCCQCYSDVQKTNIVISAVLSVI